MELDGILLSEISQSEKDNYHDFTHMWKLRNKTDKHRGTEGKKKMKIGREVDPKRLLTIGKKQGCWRGGRVGGREWNKE